MADRFTSFEKLKFHFAENRDFKIVATERQGTTCLIMAPHGGKIEKGTSELASAIAATDYSLYLFEGLLNDGNRDLHVTSHRFFEPRLDDLLNASEHAVAIHGRSNDDDHDTIDVGGLNNGLKSLIGEQLQRAGFTADTSGRRFPGAHRNNTCNRCKTGQGVQLELPLSLRQKFLEDRALMQQMAETVRLGIAELIDLG